MPGLMPYNGLLPDDQDYLKQQGLLSLAGQLLAASGPSMTPMSFGQAAGKGLLAMQQTQSQLAPQLLQSKLVKSQLEEVDAEKERRRKIAALVGRPSQTYTPGSGQGALLDQPGTGLLGALEQNDPNAMRNFYAQAAGIDPSIGIKGLMSLDKAQATRSPYFQFLPTAGGYAVGNARTGDITPPGSKPIIPAQFDPKLQSTIAGGKTTATEQAKATVEAQTTLGGALDDIEKMRANVKNLLNAPGFETIYGASSIADPRNYVPGTDASNAAAMREQLSAQTFGITIQKMRGLGQLSDAEGKKITAAYTRATNPKISDSEARKAWDEVLGYLDLAESRAKEKAKVKDTPTPQTQKVRRYNPATGRIE